MITFPQRIKVFRPAILHFSTEAISAIGCEKRDAKTTGSQTVTIRLLCSQSLHSCRASGSQALAFATKASVTELMNFGKTSVPYR
jgi:hypothetical protein